MWRIRFHYHTFVPFPEGKIWKEQRKLHHSPIFPGFVKTADEEMRYLVVVFFSVPGLSSVFANVGVHHRFILMKRVLAARVIQLCVNHRALEQSKGQNRASQGSESRLQIRDSSQNLLTQKNMVTFVVFLFELTFFQSVVDSQFSFIYWLNIFMKWLKFFLSQMNFGRISRVIGWPLSCKW